jgi:hypothetical protein
MTGQLLDTAFYGSGGILGKYGMGESKFCVLLHHPDERGNRLLIYLQMRSRDEFLVDSYISVLQLNVPKPFSPFFSSS